MANLQKYEEWKDDAVEDEGREVSKLTGGEFFKLPTGRTDIRILPPKPGQRSPFAVVSQHFLDVPGQKQRVSFVCPRAQPGRVCPVCQQADKLDSTGNPIDHDMARELQPKLRFFANILVRGQEDAGVMIFPFGKQIYDQIIEIRKEQGVDYTHPIDGFDLIMKRIGSGMQTEYKVQPSRHSTPIDEDATVVEEILESMHNLERLKRVPSDEEVRRMVSGLPSAARSGSTARERAQQSAPARRPRTAGSDAMSGEVIDADAEVVDE